jgi:hypothetical protein
MSTDELLEKLAYETDEYRGYKIKAYYCNDDGRNARIELWRCVSPNVYDKVREFFSQAYRIWNYSAHMQDIIESFIQEIAEEAVAQPKLEQATVCKWCGEPIRLNTSIAADYWVHTEFQQSRCASQTSTYAAPRVPEPNLTDVYEVYGSCAGRSGWDFLVCTTMKDALEHIETSLDSLEEGEEVKIVFRRYTKAQMEDVVYE